jgi:hypothetical protein
MMTSAETKSRVTKANVTPIRPQLSADRSIVEGREIHPRPKHAGGSAKP